MSKQIFIAAQRFAPRGIAVVGERVDAAMAEMVEFRPFCPSAADPCGPDLGRCPG